MEIRHPGFDSYYVRVDLDDKGFTFEPHCLDVPKDTLATVTWFTENPLIQFIGFQWCDENEHLAQHPLSRGPYMIGAVQTRDVEDDIYWKYQIEVEVIVGGRPRRQKSTSCTATTDGLPRIHPK